MKKILTFIMAISMFVSIFSCVAHSSDIYDLYPIANNNLLSGKTVFIDAGHGKGNYNGTSGYLEHEGNLLQAKLLKENLERCGATVIMTRPTETDVDSYVRMSNVNKYALELIKADYQARIESSSSSTEIKTLKSSVEELTKLIGIMQSVIDKPSLADTYFNSPWSRSRSINSQLKRIFEYENCDLVRNNLLFLSIHANANGSGSNDAANGTGTYYICNTLAETSKYYKNYSYVEENKNFAEILANEIAVAGSFKNRGAREDNFFMIRELNIPAVLSEVAFYTNAADRAKLMSETYQKRIASAMTYAIMKHFDKYVDPSTISEIRPTKGDVDKDGKVGNSDLVLVAKYVVGLISSLDYDLADMNSDSSVNNADVIIIARMVVGLD